MEFLLGGTASCPCLIVDARHDVLGQSFSLTHKTKAAQGGLFEGVMDLPDAATKAARHMSA